ncbi:MAG: CapA family protein [Roseburia sp.]|nr:CapA family protein [Roseburia sp.]
MDDTSPVNASISLPTAEALTDTDSSQGFKPDNFGKYEESEKTEEPVLSPTVTLMAVGDNLMHMGVIYSGYQEDNSLDYRFLYENISPFLERADIRIINQETILGGNQLGFSGYPHFNSPTEVGDSIAAAGFNVVLHASNHAADQQISGLMNCVDFWKQHPEVLMVGIHDTDTREVAPEERIPLLTVDDYTFAVLNYTYGPNMEVLPSSFQGHLDMLCDWNENNGTIDFTTLHPQVLEDIAVADRLADAVIVCPHWGTEYATVPSRYQEEFARQMTAAGADLIIGTHPHVVQPVEWITAENGNTALCFYSLGNYVSTQKEPLCMLEAMAWVTFQSTETGLAIDAEKSGAIPLVCQYTSNPVRVENIYFLEEYTKEQSAAHGIRNYGGTALEWEDLKKWENEILGDSVLPIDQIGDAASDTNQSHF